MDLSMAAGVGREVVSGLALEALRGSLCVSDAMGNR